MMLETNDELLAKFKVYKANQNNERKSFLAFGKQGKQKHSFKARRHNKRTSAKFYTKNTGWEIIQQNRHIKSLWT